MSHFLLSTRHLTVAALATLLTACGSSGGGGGSKASGELALGITDAEGDFLSYTVDVLSLELTRADGGTVETIPLSTRVDFAQYTDMTEFFSIATVPAGVYTAAKLRVSFANAEIVVEDADGNAVSAVPVDADDNALTMAELNVQLPAGENLEIVRGVPASLVVDFDLAASNEVDFSVVPVAVTVEPILVAEAEWQENRERRARGELDTVDIVNSTFVMKLLPFHHRHGTFGHLSVDVNEETVYEINGVTYTGALGLAELAGLDSDTPVVAQGLVSELEDDFSFTASEVYAGTSVIWAVHDAVRGTVVARRGDELTVRGHYFDHTDGHMEFSANITVDLADTTVFTRQALEADGLDKNSVSVGQRIEAFGAGTQVDDDTSLDTGAGQVRLLVTEIVGNVVSLPGLDQPLLMDLNSIDRSDIDLFDFAGTGVDLANNAIGAEYRVDTQTLAMPGVSVGEWIGLRGFVAPFASAPFGEVGADFIAQTVIDPVRMLRDVHLNLVWPHDEMPFDVLEDDRIVVSCGGEYVSAARRTGRGGEDHHGKGRGRGHVKGDNDCESRDSYTFVPGLTGVYTLKLVGEASMQVFTDFAAFSQALEDAVADGYEAHRLHARGAYDQDSEEFVAEAIVVMMK